MRMPPGWIRDADSLAEEASGASSGFLALAATLQQTRAARIYGSFQPRSRIFRPRNMLSFPHSQKAPVRPEKTIAAVVGPSGHPAEPPVSWVLNLMNTAQAIAILAPTMKSLATTTIAKPEGSSHSS